MDALRRALLSVLSALSVLSVAEAQTVSSLTDATLPLTNQEYLYIVQNGQPRRVHPSAVGDTLAVPTADLLGGLSNEFTQITVGSGLTLANNILTATGTGGTVTSVGLSVPATSIFGVTGSPVTTTGTLGLTTTGTSGGIPYFSSGTQLATSALLTAGSPVVGGGAGSAPVSGGWVQRVAIGWDPAIDPDENIIATIDQDSTVSSIVGTVVAAVGATATLSVYKAASGAACSAGTVLHSGSFNANGTANTNQTLTLTTTALSAGDRLCLITSDAANWLAGSGIGGVTVRLTTP